MQTERAEQAVVAMWWPQRGFGFLRVKNPDEGDWFFHASAVRFDRRAVRRGLPVTFERGCDDRGREHARNVQMIEQ